MNCLLPCIIGCILLAATSVARAAAPLPDSWSLQLQASVTRLIDAGIDAGNLMTMTAGMHKAGFDEQQIIAAQKVIHQAYRQGLPVGPLFDKAQEGLVKHVPAQLVVRAMQQVESRFRLAYGTTAALTDDETLRNDLAGMLTGAMAAGITPADMENITVSLQNRVKDYQAQDANLLLHDTLATSRDLARRGTRSGLVGEIISGLLAKGADGKDITTIVRTLTTQNNRLSTNERARLLLSIMATETSVPGLMQALRQNNSFRGNQEAPAGSGTSSEHDGKGSGGQGGNDSGNDGSGKSGGSSDSGSSGSAGNSGDSSGSGSSGGSGGSGGSGNSGHSGKP